MYNRFAAIAAAMLTVIAAAPQSGRAAQIAPPAAAAPMPRAPGAPVRVMPAPGVPGDAAIPGDFAPLPGLPVAWPTIESTLSGDDAADNTAADAEQRYTVEVIGLDALGLTGAFRQSSALWRGRGEPANIAQARRRANDDTQLIDTLLRSVGHYGGDTEVKFAAAAKAGGAASITLTVDPGPPYKFDKIAIDTPDPANAAMIAGLLGLSPGDVVVAATVNAAQAALAAQLSEKGFPFPVIGVPDIVVDHATQAVSLTQEVDPGPRGVFGVVRVEGYPVLEATHIQRLVRARPGDPYNGTELVDLRRALVATGLYAVVSVRPVKDGVDADGRVRVDIVVTGEQAPLRSVAVTAGYSTGEGIRVTGSWQHRNLLPPQGQVTFSGIAAQREQAVGAELRRHNWKQRDRTLILGANLAAQEQDAYNAKTITIGGSIERETNIIWQKSFYYSVGAQVLISNETDLSETRLGPGSLTPTLYYIVSLPLSATYDGSDDLFDPKRGFRLTARAAPQLTFQSGSFAYVKAQVEGTYYRTVNERTTLAGRLHFGSILGASRGNIAPTQRFYAGGGGSVRGFAFQGVGPRNADNIPTGGNSLTEASFEARIRFGKFGVVPFVDVGNVSQGTIPNFKNLSVGAGIGARYYTSFGPIRIDIATPVNPRPGDARIAFYVSIGQAF